jgi:transcriptional regulator MraZ
VGNCGSSGDSAVFSGRFDHSIDEKGRVSIPVRFREVLQRESHDRLYITNFKEYGQPCLEAYLPNEWENVIGKFVNKRMLDPNVQLFETFYVGGAHEVPVDKQGRILIPPKLRDFARLGHEVTFSAKHNRFQLWDKATLEQVLKAAEEQLSNPEFLQKIDF